MSKLINVTAVLLIVVLLAMPALGEKRGGMMRGKVEEMIERQEIRGTGSNFGSYVTFTVDKTIGDIRDYGISGIAVFDSIKERSINKDGTWRKKRSDAGKKKGSINKDGSFRKKRSDAGKKRN